MCAKIQQSFKDLLKTVEGVDYTERVLISENVVEKWPSSNSHNFCKNLIIINKKSHANPLRGVNYTFFPSRPLALPNPHIQPSPIDACPPFHHITCTCIT